ncbi:MAG: LysE family transporter [Desulfuromusa sp.]|nr:LysE family transporter [Desulfuromusa sp.]
MLPFLKGIGIGGGLIIAIGAQNAFVLSQGVRRNFPLQTAFVCSLSDGLLILLGVSGVGAVVATNPLLAQLATWFGALFLLWYGGRSFRSALQGGSLDASSEEIPSRRKLLLATLALTFLNPHVYLDTFVLIGGLSGQLAQTERYLFGAGAMTASFLWFFALSLGAGLLAPLFRKPLAWRFLDGFVCLTMWGIAISLLWPKLQPFIS